MLDSLEYKALTVNIYITNWKNSSKIYFFTHIFVHIKIIYCRGYITYLYDRICEIWHHISASHTVDMLMSPIAEVQAVQCTITIKSPCLHSNTIVRLMSQVTDRLLSLTVSFGETGIVNFLTISSRDMTWKFHVPSHPLMWRSRGRQRRQSQLSSLIG